MTDGTQVFDEHGGEVGADELDFNLIPATAPKWEEYRAEIKTEQTLVSERSDLLAYQEKLDTAREEIADGEISMDDLDALDTDLLEAMPSAVRTHVPGLEPVADQSGYTVEFLDQKMVSTGPISPTETGSPAPTPS